MNKNLIFKTALRTLVIYFIILFVAFISYVLINEVKDVGQSKSMCTKQECGEQIYPCKFFPDYSVTPNCNLVEYVGSTLKLSLLFFILFFVSLFLPIHIVSLFNYIFISSIFFILYFHKKRNSKSRKKANI